MRNLRLLAILFAVVGAHITLGAAGASASGPGASEVADESCGPKTDLCWPKVERGASGPRVMALQYLLRGRGYKIATDGQFAGATETILRRFQAKNRLQVDGKVGWQSWEALTPSLRRGQSGHAVRALQTLLIQSGYKVIKDGVFGVATQKAITDFRALGEPVGSDFAVDDVEWCYLSGGYRIGH